ncbi:5-(carboxyamino)imidazole ribonucleotide synthase [Parafilimonas sp.]|uniref:5-(carboxyamino)imidazole ribonucleotide synthase n=1 Tax=Parafilimonas sp. TaxID=1969739 RepID=UPI0039E38EE5
MQEQYFVYILTCCDDAYFIGLANDLIKDFRLHNEGMYEFTNMRTPVKMMYYETVPTLPDAIKRQQQLRGWSRAKKKALIEQNFHKLQLLSQCQNMSHSKYKDFDSAQSSSVPQTASIAKSPSAPLRAGILGGGQLGRMLLQAAANYAVETYILENDEHCPAAYLCHHFIKGDIRDFDTVYHFGKGLDAITIEIEAVNVEALEKLESEGVKVYPRPAVIRMIKNKVTQKEFYKQQAIPSPDFIITQNLEDVKSHADFLPAVHKIGQGGYDGKGVQVIRNPEAIGKGFNAPSVLEKMVNIQKEIAVMVAMNDKGYTAVYPATEMVFDPALNLLDYQVSPTDLPASILEEAESIAVTLVKRFNSPGLFAIEMFVDDNGKVLVNETAPRVHNSGHHTIEASYCSQYDMLWRIMLGYPLGNTDAILPSSIVNLLGEEGYSGPAIYEGIDEVLSMNNTFIHLYGKTQTRPGRKMGHVTIMSANKTDLLKKVHRIKNSLKVIS